MLKRLREQGFRVITIIDPGVKYDPGYEVFDSGLDRDVFCRTEGGDLYIGQVWPGNTAFPDFATEEARDWWGDLNAEHVESGLAGIWNDMNEPATGQIPPTRMLFRHGQVFARTAPQSVRAADGNGDHGRATQGDARAADFCPVTCGVRGHSALCGELAGDNQSRWDHLWLSIPMGNGFGVSGQPFVGADIGGFQGNSSAELFLRWMQYGVLTPFCRNHSEIGNVDQYAWAWALSLEITSGTRFGFAIGCCRTCMPASCRRQKPGLPYSVR